MTRETGEDRTPDDKHCKIVPLEQDAFAFWIVRGKDSTGTPSVYVVEFKKEKRIIDTNWSWNIIKVDVGNLSRPTGIHHDIFSEIRSGISPRATELVTSLAQQFGNRSVAEKSALAVTSYVQAQPSPHFSQRAFCNLG